MSLLKREDCLKQNIIHISTDLVTLVETKDSQGPRLETETQGEGTLQGLDVDRGRLLDVVLSVLSPLNSSHTVHEPKLYSLTG